MMTIHRCAVLATAVLCAWARAGAAAESIGVNLGMGLNFALVQQSDAADFGGGAQLGFEFRETEHFRYGVQWHHLRVGDQDEVGPEEYEDTIFLRSNALYLTARPRNKWLQWLEFRAGPVSAKYKVDLDSEIVEGGGTGLAYGIGLVAPSERFRLHLLDYQRVHAGGHTLEAYGLTVLILLGLR